MSCKIRQKKHNAIPVLKITGELTAFEINTLSKKIDSLIRGKHPIVVIDLSETTYIESHGLGVFVYAWKRMEENKRELVFLNPQGFIRDLFIGANLHQLFRIVPTLGDV